MKLIAIDKHIEGCKRGDRKSQEVIYNYFSSKMLALCIRYTKNKMEAEDILQDGFIRIFTKINSYTGEGSFEGWVRRVFVNSIITAFRKAKRQVPTIDLENGEYFTSEPFANDDVDYIWHCLNNLPENYKIPFNLFAIEGYSHQEIADMLHISPLQSRTQVCRARIILRDKVSKIRNNAPMISNNTVKYGQLAYA
ncbi:MAG: RNA polymerase sigma factor [Pelobium sp.]